MTYREWQFDGMVGPTHNYAGLAKGNLASAYNKGSVSNPRNAALQGIAKMRFVSETLGVPQGFLPPHYRPLLSELRKHGFSGDLGTQLDAAFRTAPELLAAIYSSSFMWAANAATVTSSLDNEDGRVHMTPANLSSHYHRKIESSFHYRNLSSIFHNANYFCIHNAIDEINSGGDEGAANYMSLKINDDSCSEHFFVYGKSIEETYLGASVVPRQDVQSFEAIVSNHGLKFEKCHFIGQDYGAISQGVFHNDVIALSSGSRMITHAGAYIMEHKELLCKWFAQHPEYTLRWVGEDELSVSDAVATYFFNSQMLLLPNGRYALVAPSECLNHAAVERLVQRLLSEQVLDEVHYLDVRESMRNGGGPACLRLRIVLNAEQSASIPAGIVFTPHTANALTGFINQYYRDRLEFNDLRDPEFVKELDDLYGRLEEVIGLPGHYTPYRIQSQ